MNRYAQMAVSFRNEMRQSAGALVGLVQGIMADGVLNDGEIAFLHRWLRDHQSVSQVWPGNIVAAQMSAAMADGCISDDERTQLIDTLSKLAGGTLDELSTSPSICGLALDDNCEVEFRDRTFCLTGDFAFGTRSQCESRIAAAGGIIANVNKNLHYLVMGGLGSPEWKHGTFGTKVEKAMAAKAKGAPLMIVHEDSFAAALMQIR